MPPTLTTLRFFRDQLQRLHGALLDSLKYRLEQVEGKSVGAGHWLGLLLQDPAYTWVRPLTQLLTEVDILLDEEKVEDSQILGIRERTERLFAPEDPFARRFFELLPLEPDLMMTYHHFREAKKELAD